MCRVQIEMENSVGTIVVGQYTTYVWCKALVLDVGTSCISMMLLSSSSELRRKFTFVLHFLKVVGRSSSELNHQSSDSFYANVSFLFWMFEIKSAVWNFIRTFLHFLIDWRDNALGTTLFNVFQGMNSFSFFRKINGAWFPNPTLRSSKVKYGNWKNGKKHLCNQKIRESPFIWEWQRCSKK